MLSLWNYMPAHHLEAWLKKGIYFGISCNFDDSNEGHQAEATVDKLLSLLEKTTVKQGGRVSPQLRAALKAEIRKMALSSPSQTFISCWHESKEFSASMSELYGSKGVYLRSSNHRIVDAILDASPGLAAVLTQSSNSAESPFHRVTYLPSIDEPDDLDSMTNLLSLMFYRYKHEKWAYQNELRLIIDAIELSVHTGVSINGAPLVHGTEAGWVPAKGLTIEKDDCDVVRRLFVKATPQILVEEIGVTSHSMHSRVASICSKYHLPPPRLIVMD